MRFEHSKSSMSLAINCNCHRLLDGAISDGRMVMQNRLLRMLVVALISQAPTCAIAFAADEAGRHRSTDSNMVSGQHSSMERNAQSWDALSKNAIGPERQRVFAQIKQQPDSTNCPTAATCELPKVIERAVLRTASKCGFRGTQLPNDSWRALHFNGDGKLDYLVNYGTFVCETTPTYFGLTRGSYHELWLSKRLSWQLAFSKEFFEVLKVEERDGKNIVSTSVHPSYCKLKEGVCKRELRWTGSVVHEGPPTAD